MFHNQIIVYVWQAHHQSVWMPSWQLSKSLCRSSITFTGRNILVIFQEFPGSRARIQSPFRVSNDLRLNAIVSKWTHIYRHHHGIDTIEHDCTGINISDSGTSDHPKFWNHTATNSWLMIKEDRCWIFEKFKWQLMISLNVLVIQWQVPYGPGYIMPQSFCKLSLFHE